MHVGNFQAAAGRLHEALDRLQLTWQATREEWQDENARYVEEELLEPLAKEVKAALPMVAMMTQVMGQAHRECSE